MGEHTFLVVCVVRVTNPYCDGLVYITTVSLLLHVRCASSRASKVCQPGKMEVFKMYDITNQMYQHVVSHNSLEYLNDITIFT